MVNFLPTLCAAPPCLPVRICYRERGPARVERHLAEASGVVQSTSRMEVARARDAGVAARQGKKRAREAVIPSRPCCGARHEGDWARLQDVYGLGTAGRLSVTCTGPRVLERHA